MFGQKLKGMAVVNDQRYVVVDIGDFRFGLPLSRVSNIMTITDAQAAQLAAEDVLEWRGERYSRIRVPGIEHTPQAGDSLLLVDVGCNRAQVMTAGARVSSFTTDRLLAIPRMLQRMYPWVREAFVQEGNLVYCLSPEAVAA